LITELQHFFLDYGSVPQVLVGLSKKVKQIIKIKHNNVKNPNWLEANQLAIYKRGRGSELMMLSMVLVNTTWESLQRTD